MKKGDKVRIIGNGSWNSEFIVHNYKVGSIGTIVGIYTTGHYEVQVRHKIFSSQTISAKHLQLITFDNYLKQAELCTID